MCNNGAVAAAARCLCQSAINHLQHYKPEWNEWIRINRFSFHSICRTHYGREMCVCVTGQWPCAHACGSGCRFSANKNVSQMSIRRRTHDARKQKGNKQLQQWQRHSHRTDTERRRERDGDGEIYDDKPWHTIVCTQKLKRTTTMSRLSNNGVRRSFSTFYSFYFDYDRRPTATTMAKNVWMKNSEQPCDDDTIYSFHTLFSSFFVQWNYFRFDLFTRECTCFRRTHKFNLLINK